MAQGAKNTNQTQKFAKFLGKHNVKKMKKHCDIEADLPRIYVS